MTIGGDETIYARVTTTQSKPDRADEAIRLWPDSVMLAAKKQKGFKSGRLLVTRKTGKAVSVGLWETEADAQATGEGSAFLKEQMAKFASLFTAPPVVEHYEVAAEA
jgi:heme-degrading monooxygenase HmoA